MHVIASVGLQDGIGWEDVVAFCAGATTVITFVALILRPVLREMREFTGWWRKFQRDWDGEEGYEGRDPVPGVMARLNMMDGELKRNGGASLKDQVCKIARSVDEIDHRVGAMQEQMDLIETRQREIREHTIFLRPPAETA